MRRIARPLHREDEVRRRLGMPFAEARRLLCAVEGAVDLDRGQRAARVVELTRLRQALGIEDAAPGREHPTANADADCRHANLRWTATPILAKAAGATREGHEEAIGKILDQGSMWGGLATRS